MDRKTMMTVVSLVISILMLLPASALAAKTSIDSRTLILMRETVNGKSIAPLYEYLNIEAGELMGKDISFSLGGWLRYDLGDSWAEDDTEIDLSYAFVDARFGSSSVKLGRVMVLEGAASGHVDGVYFRTSTKGGLSLAAFGGAPVEEVSGDMEAGSVYGGRLGYGNMKSISLGVSFLKQSGDIVAFDRNETGLDIWVKPLKSLEVNGMSAYNSDESEWMEHSYYLTVGPFSNMRINGLYSFVDYGSFFNATTLSVFSQLDPEEELTQTGGSIDYTYKDAYTATVDYSNYSYKLKGDASSFGAALGYAKDRYIAGISLKRMDGETDDLCYYQYRAYARKDLGKADITLDLSDVSYDVAVNGVSDAYSLVAALGYEVSRKASAGLDLEYRENPFFEEEIRALVKYNYRFSGGGGK